MRPNSKPPIELAPDPNAIRQVANLDKFLKPLEVGDDVRFVMSGFFLPREQEMYGRITSIDLCGGIKIQTTSTYRHFDSGKQIAHLSDHVYFTHHRYDSELRARVYCIDGNGHELFLAKHDGTDDGHQQDSESPSGEANDKSEQQ